MDETRHMTTPPHGEGRWIIGISGASGVVYAVRLVETLVLQRKSVYLIVSQAAKLVMKEELGCVWRDDGGTLADLWGPSAYEWITVFKNTDLAAPVASGSHPVQGMIVIPCSVGSVAAMANGLASNLLHRAADVMLKERRPLVVVPRETPLSEIHLENMLKLRRAGASIVPAMPAFYGKADRVEDLVDFVVGKVLDQVGIQHNLLSRWKAKEPQLHLEG